MVIDLAAYRQKKAHRQSVTVLEQPMLRVNGGPCSIVVHDWPAAELPPIASPALPGDGDADLEAFHRLAYALATQI